MTNVNPVIAPSSSPGEAGNAENVKIDVLQDRPKVLGVLQQTPKVLYTPTSLEVDSTITFKGNNIAASADGVSVSANLPIISVTSQSDVSTVEEHIDVVTSPDLCINIDDSIYKQDCTSLCDSEIEND